MIVVRALYLFWMVGVLVLIAFALADLLFGERPFNERLSNVLPRIAVSLLWPLALLTPRGRYLLWSRWRRS